MASDDDLFRREMADVTPIKPDNRVQERAPHRKDSIREQLRRAAAVDDRKDNPHTKRCNRPGNIINPSVLILDKDDFCGSTGTNGLNKPTTQIAVGENHY